MIRLKTEKDLEGLRESGKILARVLGELKHAAVQSIHLSFLDALARKLLKDNGAKSAFLGYHPDGSRKPYPAAICTSLNDQIVHGLPDERVLRSGDILKIDIGVNYKGYITDSATTVAIGEIPARAKKLIETTEEALKCALAACSVGNHLGDIGWEVETTVKKNGFAALRGLTGHGVGFELHEDPTVYNFGDRGKGMKLEPGLVLAIEPMVSMGSPTVIQEKDDSYVTSDGSLTAHFEHTVAITERGPEILT